MIVMAVKAQGDELAALDEIQATVKELENSLAQIRASLAEREHYRVDPDGLQACVERSGVSEEAVLAFVQTAGELLAGRELDVADARRAGMLAAARTVWENELGPLLSTAQVRELLGGVSRQRVDELLKARRLIALRDSSARWSYPLFQFSHDGPIEPLVKAFWIIADAAASAWTAASWLLTPDPQLDRKSAREWVNARGDIDRLIRVATHDAARLAQ